MQTFENFVLTDKQKEMFLKSIYNRRYAKYIKEHGMTPVNTDDFYNYTKEDLERYKRAIFSTTLNEEPVVSNFEKNLVDEVKEDVVFKPTSLEDLLSIGEDGKKTKFILNDDIIISTDMELTKELNTYGSQKDKVVAINGSLSINSHNNPVFKQQSGKSNLYLRGTGTISNTDPMGGNVIYQYNTKTKTIILGGTYYNVSGKGVDSGDTNPEVIYAEIGNIEIHGGTFRVKSNETTHEGLEEVSKFVLNCYDQAYANGTAKITVYGGEFWDFNPAESKSESPMANFVAEGYKSISKLVSENGVEHTVWTVVAE